MDTQHNDQEHLIDNKADINLSKPSRSRFLFLLFFFGYFIFAWAGCYNLWTHKYKGYNADDAPKSSLYNPEYK
ncbi:MAG: hypothetical protein JST52_03795 [Bacteroidetes bacterium]|nr:hypothetical protein [Bacteroidota bacterium]MBS1741358.1 hypothetical protein [Bacteroidota bacterium]MBS1775163.1 hypothetical protein [Bacteroidota bacterium]